MTAQPHIRLGAALMIGTGLLGGVAHAQSTVVGGLRWSPAEPTVSDINPISTSQRVMPLDMRATSSFDRLYRLESRPVFFGRNADNEYFMRRSGAVAAVFPRSAYAQTQDGILAEIPAGTVFSIGGRLDQLIDRQPEAAPSARPEAGAIERPRTIPTAQPATPARPEQATRPDYRVPSTSTPATPPERPGTKEPPDRTAPSPAPRPAVERRGPDPAAERAIAASRRSIWSDAEYRSERLRTLLQQAAAAQP